ncbi:uncharacterized protein LOC131291482 [Anopheles ziemanni]|uniref:uncharacterized protein LOC131269826 n=1 Tax=Anopheles coustani TaxID=139045 RepID=UPI00265A67E9|nr:uncharacterized protein LOC131269826 [Anopheles coustani]XP_058176684.1 uncharacterized protein LOC131291482 [Anopheles ziemanni]
MDGLPLHRSGSMQFWPILFNIHEMPKVPVMTAAIFCGMTKPTNVEEYLRPMVTEMNNIMENGINFNGKHVSIHLRAIIADTPARAFIKGVVGHAGYSSCQKCTVVGQYDSAARTIVFSGTQATQRTDEAFREGAYPGHQRTTTPRLDLRNFDIVQDVVVADRLHLIDLGIMKRLLVGWRNGTLGKRKWDQTQSELITQALQTIKLPSEIHRKLRTLKYVNFWKGSEYASFLHYASIVLLKEHLEDNVYEHFLLFFCSVTLFFSSVYQLYWPVAGEMMKKFVEDYASIYGERYISSNVHNLQHILEEVEHFGPLNTISTYPFENKLQFLKGRSQIDAVIHASDPMDLAGQTTTSNDDSMATATDSGAP